jgi:hypothetical protein
LRQRSFYITLFIALLISGSFSAGAQLYKVRGMVYDSSRNYPLEAVSVLTTSGRGTVTNADGFYEIEVLETDSVWFSYLNKPTKKFPVLQIATPLSFDISILVSVPTLKEVRVRPRYYRQDSIQNRLDYAKIFNYEKPKLRPSVTTSGVGFDLEEIINMFRFRRNRSMASFQHRLLIDEQDRFVDHRFNKALVRRLTLLEGSELDSFMRYYRPSYTFTKMAGEYEFQYYIKTAFFRFRKGLTPEGVLNKDEEE